MLDTLDGKIVVVKIKVALKNIFDSFGLTGDTWPQSSKVDIGHVNLINFLRTIRRCSEALSSVKLISCKTINPKCKAIVPIHIYCM